MVHVHEVLVRDDDTALVATHRGLRRVVDGELVPVGARSHDLMAATLDDGEILASGHPDLRDPDLIVEGRPPLLGVVASDDGEEWTARSLLGEADFHELVVVGDRLFGADFTAGAVRVSEDGGRTWASRAGDVQLVALAVDPDDDDQMLGADLDRGLVGSEDGGATWNDRDGPELVDLDWTADGAFGRDEGGAIYRSEGDSWRQVGDLAAVDALGTRGDELYALQLPATVFRSADGGLTWHEVP
ncbi:hypothetical protein PO878_04795 [Iamia majanohamensis]|uniref:Exo-alpha-sialidase n=1 Tax=Iamia majanohamensis TaxID=467976 RepID=A0AAE9Y939_9ACTN|nr:hypothetical protein [Iamia majanohamensis]WCO68041.1 hypothetical protein PO878_04795 [Iamia majanohamensis]